MLGRRLVAGRMAVRIEFDIRNQVYAHLQRLSFGFYDRNQTGQLMSRATADVSTVRVFLAYGLLFFTQYVLTVVTVLGFLVLTNPLLALVGVAIAPLLGLVAWRYSPRLAPDPDRRPAAARRRHDPGRGERRRRARREGVRAGAARVGALPAALRGRLRRERRREPPARALPAAARRSCRASASPRCSAPAARWWCTARSTLGEFVRFNLLLTMLVMPLRMLGMWVGQAQRAVASGLRVLEVLDMEPEIADAPGARPLPDGAGGDPLRARLVRLRRRPPSAARRRPRARAGLDGGADRADRLRQDDADGARAAPLRRHRGPRARRRRRRARAGAREPAPRGRHRLRGDVPVLGERAREHRLRRARRRPTRTSAAPPSARRRPSSSRACPRATRRRSASAA